jgi:glycosyltransferase involved in cell wall biosynthesis
MNVDYSDPHKGNPGIGGTQYMFWTISYYLMELFSEFEVILFAQYTERLPSNIESVKVNDILDAINKSKIMCVDIFVFGGPEKDKKVFDCIDKLKLKSIMWSHCYEDYKSLNNAAKCEYLIKNICVGKEQYDRLRDHDIFIKSKYIFNALDLSIYENYAQKNNEKQNIVCYMGAITPYKGFHVIAKCWKEIVKKVPSAKLYVIGSGKLYNKKSSMGNFGIAEESYEKKFIKYLLDKNGKILDSVKFFGVLGGNEKLKIISEAKVGIANPIGTSETFCLVATEFQAVGVPVVSKNKYGLLDTVRNGQTGYLINNNTEFIDRIVELLIDNDTNKRYSEESKWFIKHNFDIYEICNEWKNTILNIFNNDNRNIVNLKSNNYYNDLKWLRELNRNIRIKFKFIPSILCYKFIFDKFKEKIKSIFKYC